jgi:hypothetical protein
MSLQGFQYELQQARAFGRGNILRATTSFQCEDPTCPVTLVRIRFAEELGTTKPMQLPLRCPRCMAPMQRYIGLSIER